MILICASCFFHKEWWRQVTIGLSILETCAAIGMKITYLLCGERRILKNTNDAVGVDLICKSEDFHKYTITTTSLSYIPSPYANTNKSPESEREGAGKRIDG
ncbi:hypothetical protein ACJX0J_031870, partial [Zea mays]